MDTIYRSIVKQLQAEVPELRWTDLDAGQLEDPENNYPVQFPCALISFGNIAYQTLQRGTQQAMARISVKVAFDIYEDTHADSPNMVLAVNNLRLLNNIYVALHLFSGQLLPDGQGGFQDDHFSRMKRVSLNSRYYGRLKVYEMGFETTLRDVLAMKPMAEAIVDELVVTKE